VQLLSIVIPVRKEAENILRLFDALASTVASKAEVIVVPRLQTEISKELFWPRARKRAACGLRCGCR
jgi:hypothetical protein